MSEKAMWDRLRTNCRPELVLMERITERLNDGVPDVAYTLPNGTSGWLELKYLAVAPNTDAVRIPWKSAAQPLWLWRWARAGGRSGVLLQVAGLGWYYWSPTKDPGWCSSIRKPVALASATDFMPTLSVPAFLRMLG